MITLATLHEATAQEVFEQGARHLLTQMQKSVTIGSTGYSQCVYKNPEGLKCGAGIFIGEDEYDPNIENFNWIFLTRNKIVPSAHAGLITRIQSVHDQHDPKNWKSKLEQIADVFDFKMPTL